MIEVSGFQEAQVVHSAYSAECILYTGTFNSSTAYILAYRYVTSIFSPNEVSRTSWYTRLELYTVLIPGKMASVHIVRGIYIPPLRRRRQER